MPYHSILGYILLSLGLFIMLYLQYTRNKPDKTIKILKTEMFLSLLGLIFSLLALLNFVIALIYINKTLFFSYQIVFN